MYTHAYAHENTCACMTQSTRWSTDTKTHNLCKNMHTHTHTHVYKRIDVQIRTHMHIYTYIMSTHIHTYTYIHTRIQNVHMNARKARLKRRRGSDGAGSPTWHQEALPFSLSASRQRAVRPHPLICTGAEPIHPVHCPRQLPAWPWSPETRSFFCHFGGVFRARPHKWVWVVGQERRTTVIGASDIEVSSQ